MKLHIDRLGPIKRPSTLNMDKRFMVLVGENGSGKTYVANLLFGIMGGSSLLDEENYSAIHQQTVVEDNQIRIKKDALIDSFPLNKNLLERYFRGVAAKTLSEIAVTMNIEDVEDRIRKELSSFDDKIAGFGGVHDISYKLKETDFEWIWEFKCKIFNEIKIKESLIKESLVKESLINKNLINKIKEIFINEIKEILIKKITCVNSSVHDQAFFPANRASLLSTFKYIIKTERQEKDEIYRINREGRRLNQNELNHYQTSYSEAYKSLVDRLEQFDTEQLEIKDDYKDLYKELEEIMGGSIKVSETLEGFGRRRYTFEMHEGGEELELFMASSSVNQLSTLYLYFKYWAEESHNAIVIDEPEINLHPDNQIKLVNILMKFADRNNNRVVMTTHSPLIADAVNNHIRIGYLQAEGGEAEQAWLKEKEDYLKKHAFSLNEHLTYKDFVVYHFENEGIEEYPITDYGVAFKSFNQAIEEVLEVGEELKDQIYTSINGDD